MATKYDPETQHRERFLIARPEDLNQEFVYAKERRLVEIVKSELQMGRRCCHVYAVYTAGAMSHGVWRAF